MGSPTLVSLDTYLETAYRPDCDYIDGEVLERNGGEIPHGWLQRFFIKAFLVREREWNLVAIPEVRVQVAPSQFRVPDVTVLRPEQTGTLIVEAPPALCIEIFSRDDRMSPMRERVHDYRRMGVPAVWVIDPWRRVAYFGQEDGTLLLEEGVLTLPETAIAVAVDEIFAELDRLGQPS